MLTAADLDRIEKISRVSYFARNTGYGPVTVELEDYRALVAHCRATIGAELLSAELREIRERNDKQKQYGGILGSDYLTNNGAMIDRLLADAVATRNVLADALEERGGFARGFEAAKAEAVALAVPAAHQIYGNGLRCHLLPDAIAALSAEDALAELRKAGR